MSTPQGEVSAARPGSPEYLPTYTKVEGEQDGIQHLLLSLHSHSGVDWDTLNDVVESRGPAEAEGTKAGAPQPRQPIHQFPAVPSGKIPDGVTRVRQAIVWGFFEAISNQQDEAIALFLKKGLVTPNTTAQDGKTPLLAAVATRNIRIVQELIDFGAEPDAWGIETTQWDRTINQRVVVKRTPLQLAASLGHLPLVKLLMEVYHCDDSLVAPDGQIALRLAAENGHREVTRYLPSRRSGGLLRWQNHHQKAIRRAKKALDKLYRVLKFFVWDVEKFILWTLPKYLVVKPLVKGCTWCWKRRKEFGPWCHHQIQQIPIRTKRFGKWIWKGIKAIPKAAAETGKDLWKFGTVTLPRWLKKLVLWIWNLLTKKFPTAIAIAARWLWRGLSSTGKAIWDVILKALSLVHTLFEAIITFFCNLTMKDIWNGFCNFLRTIFVQIPQTIYSWILEFSEVSLKFMKALLGGLGEFIWEVIEWLGELAVYVPRQLWVMLRSLGGSFKKAGYEVMVFVSPKA